MGIKNMISRAWKIFTACLVMVIIVIVKFMMVTVEFWPWVSVAFIMSFLVGLLSPTIGWIMCGLAWAMVALKALAETEDMMSKP